MFDRFDDQAGRVLVNAREEALALGHGFLGTEHLLLGLVRDAEGLAGEVLEVLGVSAEAVRNLVRETVGTTPAPPPPDGVPPFTPRARTVFDLAQQESSALGDDHIGTEHLLLGLVREEDGGAVQVLRRLGARPDRVREEVLVRRSGD